MTPHNSTSGCYVRLDDGRRTRLFVNPEQARKAAERGETFDDAEYEVMTRVGDPGRRRAGRWICTKGF